MWRKQMMAAVGAGLTLGAGAVAAQTTPATGGNTSVPITTLPDQTAPIVTLPTPTPSPIVTPAPTATAAPVRRPAPAATPTSRASATPRAPRPTPTPTPTAAPVAVPTPTPSPAATSTPMAAATPPAAIVTTVAPLRPADEGQGHYWLAALAALVVAAAALAWVLLRRRRAAPVEPVADRPVIVEEPPVAAAAGPRARLSLGFRPLRAGINLLSATSEGEITVTNLGDAPATDVRVLVRLLAAHAGQDAELAAFYAAPIARPAVPAFTLAPGEVRMLSAVAALPREALRPLTAAGRPMFVPIVAVNILYASGEAEGQLAQAFAVGIERVDSAKLAPFWLDAPPRTYDQVAARPHAAPLER